MRSYAHWTPAYIFHRLADWLYRRIHPGDPWLTPDAIRYLSTNLGSKFAGLEYGSGRSTTWFAKRVGSLISMEHNPEWYERVKSEISHLGLSNTSYYQKPKPDTNLPLTEALVSDYVTVVSNLKEESLDFALIDGVSRPACAIHAIPLLKKGGLLIIDDANHYLPSSSTAPNSRSIKEGALNAEWQKVEDMISGWKSFWFGNGIKETAVFIKPSE